MKIDLLLTNLLYRNSYSESNKNQESLSFSGKPPEKLIAKIKTTPNYKKVKLTFDEAVKIYNYIGYDVLLKRGSHAIIKAGDYNIPLVIPHKDKHLNYNDIKRLLLIMDGNIEKASQRL